jgi:hypothetical protein
VLARSVATLDILSQGRVELGLGAGAFWDAVAAMGGERRTPAEAVESLREAVGVLRALWTDGWLGGASYAPPERLAELMRTLDEGAQGAGREPSAVRRVYIVDPSFTAAQLTELALAHGISGFMLSVDAGGAGELMRCAGEVVPAVREAVGQERGEHVPAVAVGDVRIEHRAVDSSARPTAPRPHHDSPAVTAEGERTAQTLFPATSARCTTAAVFPAVSAPRPSAPALLHGNRPPSTSPRGTTCSCASVRQHRSTPTPGSCTSQSPTVAAPDPSCRWCDGIMRPEHCVTRNHIDVWHHRVLPSGPERIRFGTVVRGSLLPILLWTGAVCFVYFVYNLVVATLLGGLFMVSFIAGFGLRRRARHSVRCSAYGALGGVLDKSMAGF